MPQNIKTNNIENIRLALNYDNYFDFMLFKGETVPVDDALDHIVEFDFSNMKLENGHLYSNKIWDKAINDGVILNNFGFTGVDNGQITYRKDRISNQEFLDIYTKSKLELPAGDLRFFVTPVSGNTLDYTYEMNPEEDYVKLNGGFFQGFFKSECDKYQVLPDKLDYIWSFNIRLRPRKDYNTPSNSLNSYIPENSGMFLFIGTRAENKFWNLYKYDKDKMDGFINEDCVPDDYSVDYSPYEETYPRGKYIAPDLEPPVIKECPPVDDYFLDYDPYERVCPDVPYNEIDYFGKDTSLDDIEPETDDGHKLDERKGKTFKTDNKFILFNNTPTGFTTNTWKEGTVVEFEQGKDLSSLSMFEIMNETPDGYNSKMVDELKELSEKPYDIIKDLYNNAIGFKLNEDGSIEYRYLVQNCESEPFHYEILTEKTAPGLVKDNEWSEIKINVVREGESYMKIFLFVNGYLKFISKMIPVIDLRALADSTEKQETVPYNISIGGGSQGLAEVIYLDYYKKSKYTLPIEKHFAGSFIGDLSSFSLYI